MTIEPALIHESAFIDKGAKVGAGTRIWHFCHVMPDAVIGERCVLGQNVVVMNGTKIGNNVKIQNNVSIYEGVELEDNVFCGPSMVFTNVINPRSHVPRKTEFKHTFVRHGATIGANATIVCGVTAKITGWVCECGVKLEDGLMELTCPADGKRYSRRGEKLTRITEENE